MYYIMVTNKLQVQLSGFQNILSKNIVLVIKFMLFGN